VTTTTPTLNNLSVLNSWANDYNTEDGVRISCPLYIDIPNSQSGRKALFNALRAAVEAEKTVATPKTQSGISVLTAASASTSIESKIGISVENARSILFSRGGLDVTLLLRLQAVTGLEVCPVSEIEKALKNRIKQIKEFSAALSSVGT
jgi:hypothetical protein